MEEKNFKAWEALKNLQIVLEKNNLLDSELRNYLWDLEDYLNDKLYYENKNLIKIVDKLTDCAYGLEYLNDDYNKELTEVVDKLFYIISLLHEIVDLQYL